MAKGKTNYPGGGVNTSDATAVAGDIVAPETAYIADGTKATGTITEKIGSATVITPSAIDQTIPEGRYGGAAGDGKVLGDADLVAANIKDTVNIFGVVGTYDHEAANPIAAGSVLSGKVGFVNGVKITGTIASKGAQTYTPGTSNQTITAGQYLSADQTISGDGDLVAANIKHGIDIFGVTGTYDTEATNPIAVGTVLSGKIGFVNGAKITGTMPNKAGDNAASSSSVASTTLKLVAPEGYYDGSDDTVTITDADFVVANIKKDINLFGLVGTLEGVPTWETETYVTDGSYRIYYRKFGKLYIPYLNGDNFNRIRGRMAPSDNSIDQTSIDRVAAMLGITISSYFLSDNQAASGGYVGYYNGSSWTSRNAADRTLLAILAA